MGKTSFEALYLEPRLFPDTFQNRDVQIFFGMGDRHFAFLYRVFELMVIPGGFVEKPSVLFEQLDDFR
jgi:hypothetical protein